MFRALPTGNKICSGKEIKSNQQLLIDHIQNMKPSINNRPPKQYGFLNNRKKKEQMQQLKQIEIDRENRHLINKITNIMQHSQQTSQSQHSGMTNSVRRAESQRIGMQKSLNKDYRKKELIKIVMENQALLRRIQSQKSKYDTKLWENDRKEIEKHIANISEYPFKELNPHKTLVQVIMVHQIKQIKFWNQPMKMNESKLSKREIPRKLDPLYQSESVNKNNQSNEAGIEESFKKQQLQLRVDEQEEEDEQQDFEEDKLISSDNQKIVMRNEDEIEKNKQIDKMIEEKNEIIEKKDKERELEKEKQQVPEQEQEQEQENKEEQEKYNAK